MKQRYDLVPANAIENDIFLIRGRRVMLNFHLAELMTPPPEKTKRPIGF